MKYKKRMPKAIWANETSEEKKIRRTKYRRDRFIRGRLLRAEWIAANGPCKRCASTERLEIDHINPALKTMEAGGIWISSESKRRSELLNCQVLCHVCHSRKSTSEDRIAPIVRCQNGHFYSKGRDCMACKSTGERSSLPESECVL